MKKSKENNKLKVTLYVIYIVVTFLISTLMLSDNSERFYYPSMTKFSLGLALLQLLFAVLLVSGSYLTKIIIGLVCSTVIPIIGSRISLRLFDKGNGIINFIDLHLLAWIALFSITIIAILITNGLLLKLDLTSSVSSKNRNVLMTENKNK